ncbi:DOMON-like domain-containing protein [Sphingomonas sp.]|uniref:DOMON-like domain-containing protein n=1 Tax=Sphingomonas sp. TaxID=28214 RepID=UPI003BAB4104
MPHPVITLDVEVTRLGETGLRLWYVVSGAVDTIRIAELGEPARVDGLWQTTCFEAFFRIGGGPAYDEINLAPSRQWAAYRFDAYREGMRPLEMVQPEITVASWAESIAVGADLDIGPQLAGPAARLALTAVIEETDGTKSYWALAHPGEKPDFHHPDGFVLALPAIP